MREQAPTSEAPYLILDLDYREGAFVLVLHNIGGRPAFKPRVEFSRRLVGVGGEVVVSELPIWTNLGMLGPGKHVEVFLDSAALALRRKGSKRFKATVSYRDDTGTAHQHRFDHDLTAYQGMPHIDTS